MTIDRVNDILDKWEFFYGQRAGRELWADKPTEVQDEDIANFCRDLGPVREALERTRWIPVSERLPEKMVPEEGGEQKRLIDADNALELFRAEYQNTENLIKQGEKQLDSLAEGYTEAAHIIKHISPTVDAVPVVRCRDCVHRQGDEYPMCMLHTEPYPNARGYKGEAVCVGMDGFCSYGKRREAEK